MEPKKQVLCVYSLHVIFLFDSRLMVLKISIVYCAKRRCKLFAMYVSYLNKDPRKSRCCQGNN